ncbi:MAG: hypothetical protein JJ920_07895 [Roseitalea sp.]|jgi:L-alanine-DL-glutamate epimerase-like enolase superfamily enzyme|nr:hypothetical protein [Roseitalea sp.]MBO6720459.1 hypothetical protein [Roseitalea sp.]MBO6742819.1 hypothetical protein [Roseitalea sp.]
MGQATITHAEVSFLAHTLDKPMGGSGVSQVDLILADIGTSDGARGVGFSYVIAGGGRFVAERAAALADRFLHGQPLAPAPAHWRDISKSFNRTGPGVNLVALAALDLALWDLDARRRDVPLATALGGEARSVPVYGSGGFAPAMAPAAAAEQAVAHVEAGFKGVKPRVGGVPADAAMIRAVCDVVGDKAWVMADMNEKGDPSRAQWFCRLAAEHGLRFVEEPLPAGDMTAYRRLSANVSVALATGEHHQGVGAFSALLTDNIAGIVQPDLAMVGGLTPALKIVHLAEALGAEVMPHFLPSLFVHLAAVSPAVTMLEDFPLLEPLFGEHAAVRDGMIKPDASKAGHGIRLAPALLKNATVLA